MNTKKIIKSLFITSITLFILSSICFFKGIDKKTNYYNGNYSEKNAYVGGDAYNFIINAEYASGYYILSMGWFISGIICTNTAAILSIYTKKEITNESLPPL